MRVPEVDPARWQDQLRELDVAVRAADSMSLYIAADAYEGALIVSRYGVDTEEATKRRLGEIQAYYKSLPRDRFPSLATYAEELVQADSEERFAFGLDMLIRSLETYTLKPRERS